MRGVLAILLIGCLLVLPVAVALPVAMAFVDPQLAAAPSVIATIACDAQSLALASTASLRAPPRIR
jgi:hypothetical protein